VGAGDRHGPVCFHDLAHREPRLLGVLGDCTWSRIAAALNQRRLRPLAMPFTLFVVLPMALCGLGWSKAKTITAPMQVAAALGALVLGLIIGGIVANVSRRREMPQDFTIKGGGK
jgi:hypothetical protein